MNINYAVSKNDVLQVLGDFALSSFDKMKEYVSRIHCQDKRLVMGNHDGYSVKRYYEAGWKFVSKYPVLVEEYIWLSHKPVFLMSGSPIINLHGHVHGTLPYRPSEQYWNLSVEVTDYEPISLYNIYQEIKEQGGHPEE